MDDAHRPIELMDLGDAMIETKQCAPVAFVPDSWFQWGLVEYQGGHTPQCP